MTVVDRQSISDTSLLLRPFAAFGTQIGAQVFVVCCDAVSLRRKFVTFSTIAALRFLRLLLS